MNSGAETFRLAAAPMLPDWVETQFAALQSELAASETITAAPIAPALIDGGLAAPGLHAWVTAAD